MQLPEWWELIKQKYEELGITKDTFTSSFLLSKPPEFIMDEHRAIIWEVSDMVWRIIFAKATTGDAFGDPGRIKQRFGESVEEIYGLYEGPFINLARAYWTYRLGIDDLTPIYDETALAMILARVEADFNFVFFGPSELPVVLLKAQQIDLLNKYAPPELDIQRLLRENPLLRLRLTREENPEEIKTYSHIKPASRSTARCNATYSGTSRTCSSEKYHSGPRVARHGLFEKEEYVYIYSSPGKGRTCSLERYHSGPHIAHKGLFKKIYAVWED